ncbi:acid protease [Dothidotthia symphoricarpi CBS 119687]|uniref:Acid protease n=1 Tax=Dothidotthia symphoricarpi CBS 119687 TaxID=1392245 RepID=A0A6A6A3H1_9PLEO|nr:acid protease [Dothidotthia symphoricarpi CBS 119687]KAF2125131.1 acid protease [Dothidotthia symphoricarpi CBS 119687]
MNSPSGRHAATHRAAIVVVFVCSTILVLLLWGVGDVKNLIGNGIESHKDVGDKGVASLDVYIPPGRTDDSYQNVDIQFDGQRLAFTLETSSADNFVASEECDTVDRTSGCYQLEKSYHINDKTTFLSGDGFDTFLGKGRVIGNLSSISVSLGSLYVENATTALINNATIDEFQNGSFSGVLGLGLRTTSQQWLKYGRLPIVDTLISQNVLKQPVFSLRSPRYGDPEQHTGRLTLGAIESVPQSINITYRDVVPFSRNEHRLDHLETIAWSTILEGLRINSVEISVTPGRLRSDHQHVSVLDSGSSYIYLRNRDFYTIVEYLHGATATETHPNGDKIYVECDQPQLLEFKFHDRWFLIDPLDMLLAGSRQLINGTVMCEANLRTWEFSTFGDSIMGLPFLRSAFVVFDYVSADMYSTSPRLGIASMVDKDMAMKRYAALYSNRLQQIDSVDNKAAL